MCYWFKRPSILYQEFRLPWMWISVGKKQQQTTSRVEAIFRVQNGPNSVSCQRMQLTWKLYQEKTTLKSNPWNGYLVEHLYKIPPKKIQETWPLSIGLLHFPSVAWLFRQGFIRLHCPTPGAMGTHRWDHDTHAMLKEKKMRNKKRTKTQNSLFWNWCLDCLIIESNNLRIIRLLA